MKIVLAALLGAVLLGGAAVSLGHIDTSAPDDHCTKVCPLTGDEIAADECPLGEEATGPHHGAKALADGASGPCPFSKDAAASDESGNWFCNLLGGLFGCDEKTAAQAGACETSSAACETPKAAAESDCCAKSAP